MLPSDASPKNTPQDTAGEVEQCTAEEEQAAKEDDQQQEPPKDGSSNSPKKDAHKKKWSDDEIDLLVLAVKRNTPEGAKLPKNWKLVSEEVEMMFPGHNMKDCVQKWMKIKHLH